MIEITTNSDLCEGERKFININGVVISEKTTSGHKEIENALCECGEKLIVAPEMFQRLINEDGGNRLVVSCFDHAHALYYFDQLEVGRQ